MAPNIRNIDIRDRLGRERAGKRLADELDEIALHCARLPVLDPRTPDEILGYDEHGLPRQRLAVRGVTARHRAGRSRK